MNGEEVPLLQLMRLDSMINDGPRLVENASLTRVDKPMEVIGLGALEQFTALAPFAFATQLGIEEADSLDHAPVKGHVAAERVTALAVHPERFVPVILIAQKAGDFRAGNDPGRQA